MKNILFLFLASESKECSKEDTELLTGRSGIVDSLRHGFVKLLLTPTLAGWLCDD